MKPATVVLMAVLAGSVAEAQMGLWEAVGNGNVTEIKRSIRSDADLNTRNEAGATPLMYAAAFASEDCVRLLSMRGPMSMRLPTEAPRP